MRNPVVGIHFVHECRSGKRYSRVPRDIRDRMHERSKYLEKLSVNLQRLLVFKLDASNRPFVQVIQSRLFWARQYFIHLQNSVLRNKLLVSGLYDFPM